MEKFKGCCVIMKRRRQAMQKTTYAEYKMMLKAFSKLKLFRLNGLELQKLLTAKISRFA